MDIIQILFGSVAGSGIFLLGGIIAVVVLIYHSRKIPSPEESERAFSALKERVVRWQTEGLVSREEADKIIDRYQSLAGQRSVLKKQKIVSRFAVFGALLIGLGLILFVSANWSSVPKLFKTAVLILSTLAVYFVAWRFQFNKAAHLKMGSALMFLGSLMFGASLILIAQTYHVAIEPSFLMLTWGLAILPLAFFARSFLVLSLSGLIIFAWGFSFIPQALLGFSRLGDEVFSWQYYISFLLLAGLAVPLSYFLRSSFSLSLTLAEIIIWLWPLAAFGLFEGESFFLDFCLFFLAVGAAFVFIGHLHRRWLRFSDFKHVYNSIGLCLVFVFTLLLTYPNLYRTSFWPVFFNLILFGFICFAVYWGLKKEEGLFVGLANLFFILLVLVRYFDSRWSLSVRSVVFLAGGLLLIGGSYLVSRYKRRTTAIQSVDSAELDSNESYENQL